MYAGVVLGGMGSILGAFWGGLTIGLVQQLSTLVLPTQLQNTAIFVVFLLIIFFARRASSAVSRSAPDDRAHRRAAHATASCSRASPCLSAGSRLLVQQLLLPADADAGAGLGRAWACPGTSCSGYTGLISFGHAAFFGLGAYAVTLLSSTFRHVTPWLGIPLGDARRRGRGAPHRPADLPAARALLRPGDARLSAGDALRLRMARLPGGLAADEARGARGYHAVQRSRASIRSIALACCSSAMV